MKKEKDKVPFYSIKNDGIKEDDVEQKYCSVIKSKKNANITKDNFGEIILCQIPGISDKTAIAIMKEFKTINNLIEKLKENTEILNTFTYENEKQKNRKLNKTCIKNILEFLIQ